MPAAGRLQRTHMRTRPAHAPSASPARQVRGELTGEARRKVNTLIITDVHGRDIVDGFVRDSVADAADFAWESQLRFYWERGQARGGVGGRQLAAGQGWSEPAVCTHRLRGRCMCGALAYALESAKHGLALTFFPPTHLSQPAFNPALQDDMSIRQCTGAFRYGYEYMGLNGRLVITALTDRLGLGSAPVGRGLAARLDEPHAASLHALVLVGAGVETAVTASRLPRASAGAI